MTHAALGLVLAAAFVHATWNFLAKRAGGGAAFVWLFGVLSTAMYAPLAAAVVIWQRPHIGPIQILFLAGTAVLHLAYFLALQAGYRAGDLSLVYPLARGTGPMLSTAAAILVLGERPTPVALAGTLLIGGGIFLLAAGPHAPGRHGAGQPVAFALVTGAFIAAYTLWDKHAVSALAVPPLLLDWCDNFGRAAFLTPVALRRREEVRELWRTRRSDVLWVAALTPLAYLLVLTAMVRTPVSYVAPAREISILIGTVMGTRLLAEGNATRRLVAAAAMVGGVSALALG